MSIPITFNGVEYDIPEFRDTNYANELTQFFVAIPNGVLQPTAGLFTLLAELDFGASFGVKSLYVKSRAANPAAAGIFRLGNTESVSWRNAANSADLALSVSAANLLQFAGANVFVFGTSTIADSDLGNSINATHIANGSVSNTEFQYLDGVTSAIQSQLDSKVNDTGDTMTGALGIGGAADASSLLTITSTTKGFLPPRMTTAQRDLIGSPAEGLVIYNTTTGQLNLYASGVWAALAASGGGTVNSGTQNQLTYYAANGTAVSGLTAITANRALASNASGLPVASAVTDTELGYVSGVTSAIQTQLAARALDSAVVHNTGAEAVAGQKTFSDRVVGKDGSAASPSFAFASSLTTGIASLNANEISFVTNGVRSWRIQSGNVLSAEAAGATIQSTAGTLTNPGYAFDTDANSGLMSGGADIVQIVTGGVARLIVGATGITTINSLSATLGANLAAGGFKLTGLAAGSAAGDSLRFEQMQVVQYAYGTSTTGSTTTSSSFQNTNLSVAITPTSASNKVLIFAFGCLQHGAQGFSGVATIARDTTDLQSGGQPDINTTSGGSTVVPASLMVLDSPATTSATTYRVRIKTVSGGGQTGWGNGNATFQSIIAIEVKG